MFPIFHSLPASSVVRLLSLVGVVAVVKLGLRIWHDMGGRAK